MRTKSKPKAFLVSDVHFSLPTLEVATKALNMAVDAANSANVPLIIAGDLHDTKANLRGECVKVILDVLERAKTKPTVLVGNHDLINEKSVEHSLEFLRYSTNLISSYVHNTDLDLHLIPYQHSPDRLREILATIPQDSQLIMHQGFCGALPGGYAFDKSALDPSEYLPFNIISGHYHQPQALNEGRFTYIGNPYTLDYSEASHGSKGGLFLLDDGSIDRVAFNLRKHVVISLLASELKNKGLPEVTAGDLTLVKITGTKKELAKVTREGVESLLGGRISRLDLIPSETEPTQVQRTADQTTEELFEAIVDSKKELTDRDRTKVKNLWKGLK